MAFPEYAIFHEPSEVFAPEHKTGGPPQSSAGPETPQQLDQAMENPSMLSLTQKDSLTDNLSLLAEHEHTEQSSDEVRAMGQSAQSLEATAMLGEGQTLKGERTINVFSVVERREDKSVDSFNEQREEDEEYPFRDFSKFQKGPMSRRKAEAFLKAYYTSDPLLYIEDEEQHGIINDLTDRIQKVYPELFENVTNRYIGFLERRMKLVNWYFSDKYGKK